MEALLQELASSDPALRLRFSRERSLDTKSEECPMAKWQETCHMVFVAFGMAISSLLSSPY